MKSKRSSAPARLFLGTLLVLTLLGLTSTSQAQTIAGGQIVGVVQDPTGAVIPGAQVVVRNVATGMERTLTTSEVGRYQALNLRSGEYEVTVEQSGFATMRHTGIVLEVGSTATVNITLQVAATAEIITVMEDAAIIEPERMEYTVTVSQTAVENLPINGRRWDRFMLLTPTVAPDGDFGLISVRGISGLYNNNTVDGADNNQAFFSEARGRTRVVYTLSQAAIKEFQVGISNFSAEHGRAVGGTVNAVTKSGGNALHGEAFYFIRDDAFNAQEPFNKAEGFNKLPERRQQFGFSMGGPVKQDKVFWYLNYDQQVRNFPGVAINEGNDLTDPAATPCDIPNVPSRCDAARAFLLSQLGIFSRKGHNNVALGKIDWNISPSQNFSVQYNYHKWRSPNGIQTQARTNDTALANGFDGVRTDMLLFRLTSLPSASTVNEFRFQYGRDFEFQRNNAPGPFIDLRGNLNIDTGMREFLPRIAFPDEKRYQWTDNFSWVRGKHMIKFGADINYVREKMINLFRGGAEFEFFSFEDYARDVPLPGLPQDPDGAFTGMHYGNFFQAFDVTTGGIGQISFTTTDWNFYVHDTFKAHPHLTMNFGLRYEYADLPQPDQSIFATPSAEFASLPAAIQAQAQRLNNDTNNFGPRVALAWDIGGKQKMVVRAGYGLYYGRTSNSALAAGLFESNAITRFSIRLRPGREPDAPVFPNTFCTPALGTPGVESVCTPPGATGGVALNLFTEDFVRPLIHSTEFELEYALTPNTSISASYLGTRGQRLPAFIDRNLNAPTDTVTIEDNNGQIMGVIPFFEGPRPFSQLGGIIQSESVVNSWYNALVLRVKRRLSRGLQFDSHLTISKALDDGQSSTTFFSFFSQRVNPFDGANEYGLSNFDISKKWVSHFYWDPPFERIENKGLRNAFDGFKFSGIVTLRDGRAFPATVSMNRINPFSLFLGWNAVSTFTANGTGADGRLPTIGRNPFTTTNFANVDFRVTREFTITEGTKAVFIWEAFNLFNRVNFNRFRNGAFFGSADCVQSGGFGSLCLPGTRTVTLSPRSNFLEPTAASNTLSGPREMQFAFKFIW
ncbi:MAG: TonB-dependent receptor [Acidobacteria bacterium]|nr:TonB-dependent receptor [Acidobacteriota bacterium]